ncbi:MAG: hypothetical protein JXR83_19015 [Deltaproteobacteria bacterium]|nr:hypothetical protein [Deltaproteobacteria bacterium]
MVARAYHPSGKSAPGALIKLVLLAMVAGVAIGAVESIVSKYVVNLVLIFPLLIGMVVGGVATRQIKTGKIRAPGSAALLACLGALVGQATIHYVDYLLWRNQVVQEIRADTEAARANPEVGAEEKAELAQITPEQQLDGFLELKYGRGGFLGYLQLAAESGVSISRAGHSVGEDSDPTLTGSGVYTLWGLEFLLAAGVAFFMAYSRARHPFCEICDAWYDRTVAIAVGNGQKQPVKDLIKTIEAADWSAMLAPATLGEPTKGLSSVVLVERCATCEEHEPLLSVKVVRQTGKGKAQTSERYRTMIRTDEMRAIAKILDQQAAAEQVAADAQATASADARS